MMYAFQIFVKNRICKQTKNMVVALIHVTNKKKKFNKLFQILDKNKISEQMKQDCNKEMINKIQKSLDKKKNKAQRPTQCPINQ